MILKKIGRHIVGFFSATVLTLNIIAVIAMLLCYIASYIEPDTFWPMVFFGLAYPFILITNTLFFLYWLLRFKKWMFLSLITIAVGWNYHKSFVKFSGLDDHPVPSANIRVMSFNVKDFDRRNRINKEKGFTRKMIFRMLKEESPDIICFQDFYSDNSPLFNTVDTLTQKYGLPFFHTAHANQRHGKRFSGTATFSKFPIVHSGNHVFSNLLDYIAISTDIAIKSDTFRIINIHFKSNMLSEDERLIFHEIPPTEKQEETVNKFRDVIEKVKESSKLRATQSREVRKLIDESPHPVILCCDLNDTHASYAYKQVTSSLNDAFVESGKGFGSTHIGLLPVLRIDYILHDPFFSSWAFKTIHKHLSDHYPIVTNLAYTATGTKSE